jgi:hypothetical protein
LKKLNVATCFQQTACGVCLWAKPMGKLVGESMGKSPGSIRPPNVKSQEIETETPHRFTAIE